MTGLPARAALGALLAYAAIVAALTWPLARHLGTHLPMIHVSSEYDGLFLAWSLAYQSHALTSAPAALADANIFYPARHALFYGETGFGALPYFAPTFLATHNPVLALNVMVLACVTLTAWALHLVVHRWTGSHAAGFVAASTLLLTRWVLPGGIAGAPNFAVLQYFPPIIYLAATPALPLVRATMLGGLVLLQGLTSAYMAAAVFVPLGVLAAWRALRRATRADGLRLAIVLGSAALLLAPFYAGHVVVARENVGLQDQSFFVRFKQAADLPFGPLSYWTPTGVPAAALAVVAAGLLARRRRRPDGIPRAAWLHGALWAGLGLLMALPPTAHVAGTEITLPYAVPARALGVYDLFRVVDRLGVAALMGVAVLAGLGCAEATANRAGLRRGAVALVLVLLMFVEYLRGPELPLVGRLRTHTYFATVAGFPAGVRVPSQLYIRPAFSPLDYPLLDERVQFPEPAIRAVLEAPGGPVLDVPVGIGPGGSPVLQARATFRSTFGWRPLLNGYSRYFPAGFPALMNLARQLPDARALAELRRETHLELVLVHLRDLEPSERAAWLSLVDQRGRPDLALVARGADDVLFRVADAG